MTYLSSISNPSPSLLKSRLLLFILTSCLSLSASAQSETKLDSILTQPTFSGDTVQAIHQLFTIRRRGANITTGVGLTVAAGGFLLAQLSYAVANSVQTANNRKSLEPGPAAASLKLSLPGLFITTIGIIKRVRFNRDRESSVIFAYEQGQDLPRDIQRLFREGHFFYNH